MTTEGSQALKYGMWSRQPVASDHDEAWLPRQVQNGVQNRKKYSPDILRPKTNDLGETSWSHTETFSSFIPLYSEFLMTIGTRLMIQELSKSILRVGQRSWAKCRNPHPKLRKITFPIWQNREARSKAIVLNFDDFIKNVKFRVNQWSHRPAAPLNTRILFTGAMLHAS